MLWMASISSLLLCLWSYIHCWSCLELPHVRFPHNPSQWGSGPHCQPSHRSVSQRMCGPSPPCSRSLKKLCHLPLPIRDDSAQLDIRAQEFLGFTTTASFLPCESLQPPAHRGSELSACYRKRETGCAVQRGVVSGGVRGACSGVLFRGGVVSGVGGWGQKSPWVTCERVPSYPLFSVLLEKSVTVTYKLLTLMISNKLELP